MRSTQVPVETMMTISKVEKKPSWISSQEKATHMMMERSQKKRMMI
jgi:hypothetical protein